MSKQAVPGPSTSRRIEMGVYTVMGIAMTVLMFTNAVMRYAFDSSLVWSEEVIRMLFVGAMFIAITGGFLRNEHIGFDSLAKIPGVLNTTYRIVYALCLVIVGGLLAWHGGRFTLMTGDVPLPATNIPTAVFMWPGVIAGAVWVLIGLQRLADVLRGRKGGGA